MMLDEQMTRQVRRYEEVTLVSYRTETGALKELNFSGYDRCFYVTVNGREKFRGDISDTAYNYFCDVAA